MYAEKLWRWVSSMEADAKKKKKVVAQPLEKKEEEKPEKIIPSENVVAVGLREWLKTVDESGALDCYLNILASNFDSVMHIVDSYVDSGKLDKQFFDDLGIKKLGHKRKFLQWFELHLDEIVLVQANIDHAV